MIRVERGWDPKEGAIEPKSRAGRRRVPLARPLRLLLAEHKLKVGESSADALVFGRPDGRPLAADALIERSRKRWQAGGLQPIGLHECRLTYAAS